MIQRANEFGLKLLTALQLPVDNVRAIIITVTANDAVTVEVHRFLTTDEAERLLDVVERYDVVPKENPAG